MIAREWIDRSQLNIPSTDEDTYDRLEEFADDVAEMDALNLELMFDKMDEKQSYRIEGDDRTFSNQDTPKGHWVDGYRECYKDMMKILKQFLVD